MGFPAWVCPGSAAPAARMHPLAGKGAFILLAEGDLVFHSLPNSQLASGVGAEGMWSFCRHLRPQAALVGLLR